MSYSLCKNNRMLRCSSLTACLSLYTFAVDIGQPRDGGRQYIQTKSKDGSHNRKEKNQ